MKTIMMGLFVLFGLTVWGQEDHRGPRHGKKDKLTAEQRSVLQTKKLTLALDLTTDQQEQMQAVLLKKEEERDVRMAARKEMQEEQDPKELSSEKRFEKMNERLDALIAHKKEIKTILSADQFEKWEKLVHHKKHRAKHQKRGKGKKQHSRRS
ncbi:MAG: hypothetical protein OER83_07800 [Flavobacteriaceae bacterium]|nr:hypothetical protein [Flavobacteriaceae bacterium]MDH3796760.1 hypothetical protein [Flavobacteriaceae bacterium]